MTFDPLTGATAGALVKATVDESVKTAAGLVTRILGPAADEVGETLRLAVRATLAPLRERWLTQQEAGELALEAATRRLTGIPHARLRTPAPEVLAGVVEGLQTRAEVPELRSMFAQPLATAMMEDEQGIAHPSFAEIIRQLTADEARLLQFCVRERAEVDGEAVYVPALPEAAEPTDSHREWLAKLGVQAGCVHPWFTGEYVENLVRLGILRQPPTFAAPSANAIRQQRWFVLFSLFGARFVAACIDPTFVVDRPHDAPLGGFNPRQDQ